MQCKNFSGCGDGDDDHGAAVVDEARRMNNNSPSTTANNFTLAILSLHTLTLSEISLKALLSYYGLSTGELLLIDGENIYVCPLARDSVSEK